MRHACGSTPGRRGAAFWPAGKRSPAIQTKRPVRTASASSESTTKGPRMGKQRTIKEWIYLDGEQVEVELPALRIVCRRCDGTGTHVNPNIDGNGISPEEFAEDPDFEEAYFEGRYDVRCEECEGAKVTDVVDYEACTQEQREGLDMMENERAADAAERDMERRMGC